jgi:hypothetical protein
MVTWTRFVRRRRTGSPVEIEPPGWTGRAFVVTGRVVAEGDRLAVGRLDRDRGRGRTREGDQSEQREQRRGDGRADEDR